MSTKVQKYIDEALAASGFVVLHHRAAMVVRTDLWTSGVECAGDFATPHWKNRLGALVGVKRFHVRFSEIDGPVEVLTRSADSLARRIAWVSGLEVLALESEKHRAPVTSGSPRPTASVRVVNGDLYAGTETREPGRTCASCDHMSVGHTCRVAEQSGVERPLVNAQRRCVAYAPLWDASDSRGASALWPELFAKPQAANARRRA